MMVQTLLMPWNKWIKTKISLMRILTLFIGTAMMFITLLLINSISPKVTGAPKTVNLSLMARLKWSKLRITLILIPNLLMTSLSSHQFIVTALMILILLMTNGSSLRVIGAVKKHTLLISRTKIHKFNRKITLKINLTYKLSQKSQKSSRSKQH